jgi:hypothetical protein
MGREGGRRWGRRCEIAITTKSIETTMIFDDLSEL